VLDLGAGVGILGLSTSRLTRVRWLGLVESDPGLAALAERNLQAAGVEGAVVRARIGTDRAVAHFTRAADTVVCNPPFFRNEGSQLPASETLRQSRIGDVAPFLECATCALKRRGSAYFVYPAGALAEFFELARRSGLEPKRLRFVHAFRDSPARITLLELKRGRPGGLVVEPPLFEWEGRGERSGEVADLIEGRTIDRRLWPPQRER
jgi:tRNA1Val (adenine37-N6)-methyltransferase